MKKILDIIIYEYIWYNIKEQILNIIKKYEWFIIYYQCWLLAKPW